MGLYSLLLYNRAVPPTLSLLLKHRLLWKLVCIFQLALICRNLLYCSVTLCPLLTPKATRLCLPHLLSFSTRTYKAQILNVHDFTRRGNSDSMYCLELQIHFYLEANLAGCADIRKRGKSSFIVSAEGEVWQRTPLCLPYNTTAFLVVGYKWVCLRLMISGSLSSWPAQPII